MDLELYKESFNYLVEHLPEKSAVIELGCGPGNVIRYLSSQRSDIEFIGIDLAPAMIKAAEKVNPGHRFYVLDMRDLDIIANRVEGVIAAFSIPYILPGDLEKFFADCNKILKPGGLFYLSCMEGPEERSGFEKTSFTGEDEMHISYYQKEVVEKMMKLNDLEIVEFSSQDYPEMDGSVTTDLFYICKKKSRT
jgi:cyclopropane fatty-acyl-phospholipid synthase-like methyltransferase